VDEGWCVYVIGRLKAIEAAKTMVLTADGETWKCGFLSVSSSRKGCWGD